MGVPTVFPKLRGGDERLSRAQDLINQPLQAAAQALSQTPIMGVAPVWTAFPLDPAFANLNTFPGFELFAGGNYYKDTLFRIWAIGVLRCAAGCGAGAVVGTFPSGFRPGTVQRKAVEGNAGFPQEISISPTGVCTVEVAIAAGGTVDFDFSFLAER